MVKREKNKTISTSLDTYSRSFLNFLKKDWKENKYKNDKNDGCFLYQYFSSKSQDPDEKIRKRISEFFYNIENGRAFPLTLPLLIEFCNYCEKTPNQILKFQQDKNQSDVACDIKTIEKRIRTKLLNRNIILPIKADTRYTTTLYIRFKYNKIDYIVTSVPFPDIFAYDVEKEESESSFVEEKNKFYCAIEVYIFETYSKALSEYEYRINNYSVDLSDDDDKINWINPKLLDMFETSLFYYEETSSALDSIDDKIEHHPKDARKQMPFSHER